MESIKAATLKLRLSIRARVMLNPRQPLHLGVHEEASKVTAAALAKIWAERKRWQRNGEMRRGRNGETRRWEDGETAAALA